MRLQSSRITMFVLIGVLFLTVSTVYAKTAEEYFQSGLTYANQGNFSQAILEFSAAIQILPNNANLYYNRGLMYDKIGDYVHSIADYTKVLEIDPKYVAAYNNRAIAYYAINQYAKAWDDVYKAEALGLNVHPEFLNALKKVTGREK